jgi:RecB family endonuclease NucS
MARRELVLVVGRCKVSYEGRAASKLSEGDRLLIIKHDGTFLVHQSAKMSAINYQGPGAFVSCELALDPNDRKKREPVAIVLSAKRKLANGAVEQIVVRFTEILYAGAYGLKDDSHLKLFGTEKELADLLMSDLHLIEPGMVPLKQESDVRKGTIDILARDAAGNTVVIEVKRRIAGLEAVTQLERYVKELSQRRGSKIRGILCAPDVTASALKMLEESGGLEFAKLDYEIANPSAKIRGLQKKQKIITEYFG